MSKTGQFITFEGGEGSGKSTQIKRLAQLLTDTGHHCLVTREPGGTPISDRIRAILLHPENDAMVPLAELFLYEASRAQHVEEKIRPALKAGTTVLCDRFADSTVAYQSAGRKLPMALIQSLNRAATSNLTPNLTVILDIKPETGIARAKGATALSEQRFEHEALAFHRKVRKAFLDMAKKKPRRYLVIDASLPADAVFEKLLAALHKRKLLT